MSQSLLLFHIDPPQLTPEPCPAIPQAFHLANPAAAGMTPRKFLHLLNVLVAQVEKKRRQINLPTRESI